MGRRALVLALLLAGCTSLTSHPEYQGAPDAPLAVTVTFSPAAAADGTVQRDADVVLVTDGYPDPSTVSFGPLLLRSGRGNFDITVSVDLVAKSIVVHPRSLLDANTTYEIVVGGAVASLDGRVVGGAGLVQQISVGSAVGRFTPPPAPVYSDVAGLLQDCATFCHSTVDANQDPQPPMRALNFFGSPSDPVYGLIDVPSVGQAGTDHPMARVAPGDSSRSVLLRKLLGGNAHEDSMDEPYPEMGVDGRRMPIGANGAPEAALPDDQILLIQHWIDGGAIVTP